MRAISLTVLAVLLIILLFHESFCKNDSCFIGSNQRLFDGQTIYNFEVHDNAEVCAIQKCVTIPFPQVSTVLQSCSSVKDNCSVVLASEDQNLSICCRFCSACDFFTCPENSFCLVDNDYFASCTCQKGYQTFADSGGSLKCMDMDECTAGTHSCPVNSDCVNALGSFNCLCHSGYDGPVCSDVNECVAVPDICPTFAQCANYNGSYECICTEKCTVNITTYYLTTPSNPANFLELNPNCSYAGDDTTTSDMVVCKGKSAVLTDGIAEPMLPPMPCQYVEWDKNSNGFTITVDKQHLRMTQLNIYYYNYPKIGLGLPPLSSIYVSSVKASGTLVGPISFFYMNNQDLAQDDNKIRMVSIVINGIKNEATFSQFVHFTFNYSSSLIWRSQLIEIQAYGGTDSTSLGDEITISEPLKVIHHGAENIVSQVALTCTVANQGSFSWQWTKPFNDLIINSEMKQADLTRTSILIINDLSIEAGGEYRCTAIYSNESSSIESTAIVVLELESDVIKENTMLSNFGNDLTLSCEFIGYYPKTEYIVVWDHEGKSISQDSRKYSISNRSGAEGLSQSGGSSSGPSLISYLTISTVEQADIGIYGCRIIGSVRCSQVIGYIQVSTDPSQLTSAETMHSSTCPSPNANFISTNGEVWLSLFVLATVVLAVMSIILIVIVFHKHFPGAIHRISLHSFFFTKKQRSDYMDQSSTHSMLDKE